MTHAELQALVPVLKNASDRYIRLRDVPNPYRSEFASDCIDASCMDVPGEGPSYLVGDWALWLSSRFQSDYAPRYGGVLYREITDAELA